ncbi:hypothetical protein RRG08_052380 [Elysia crispata]|uniref:Uncharacterized protein n=1 Tax=Elysia crispata TaxID=231223 RepID=A0AAE1DT59_9GAST|nr:hypothetical protein RRG08_052380 [Elysia crispata]
MKRKREIANARAGQREISQKIWAPYCLPLEELPPPKGDAVPHKPGRRAHKLEPAATRSSGMARRSEMGAKMRPLNQNHKLAVSSWRSPGLGSSGTHRDGRGLDPLASCRE